VCCMGYSGLKQQKQIYKYNNLHVISFFVTIHEVKEELSNSKNEPPTGTINIKLRMVTVCEGEDILKHCGFMVHSDVADRPTLPINT